MDCPSAHGYELTDKHPSILALVDGKVFVALEPLLDLWFRPLAGGQVWRQLVWCGVVLEAAGHLGAR